MPAIQLQHAESSHIKGASYDADTQELVVNFSKASYAYSGVSEETALAFEKAESAGQYLENFIKGSYPYRKL